VLGRGLAAGAFQLGLHDLRAHGLGRHRTVDDAPYGGGPGMVLRVDVVAAALAAVRGPDARVVWLSASGAPFDQAVARRYARLPHLVLLCGHYEGVDERVASLVDEELSIGDYVLTGGEIAAAAVIDATARLLPGVLGNEASPADESFGDGTLEYPQYTRPPVFEGLAVPDVLVSGHHERVSAWRSAERERRTRERRPDLWARRVDGGRPSD
jgi:tRNA (guanine37-N1)-methyltransferase